jgi:hypothetical protein
MALNPWKAPAEVVELMNKVKDAHHAERLAGASICVCFDDSKPFLRNKLNLGKVTKFSPLAKLWQNQRHDFCISVPADLWHSVLQAEQREPYLDLQLARCEVEYEPEMAVDAQGKRKPVKDQWGRVQYTKVWKEDAEGNPKWKVVPLDLEVFTGNVRRYGLWCDVLLDLKDAIIIAATGPTAGGEGDETAHI